MDFEIYGFYNKKKLIIESIQLMNSSLEKLFQELPKDKVKYLSQKFFRKQRKSVKKKKSNISI